MNAQRPPADTGSEGRLPDHIGKYEILEQIGRGGFGVVYRGRDPFIKRQVAIKTCASGNSVIRQRFFREAEIAGNLHHSNIVTIHDFGIDETTPFLVQEFLSGEDLDSLIERHEQPLELAFKVHCLREIADALAFAHGRGVIHRDIKPGNVRVLSSGQVKVMDFGIAKLKGEDSQLTRTGMALGTAAYLSPEQLRGEEIDHRTDIFSFGVLAYELLAGRRPFLAESVTAVFYRILNEQPAAVSAADVPEPLAQLVRHCLAKEPEDRPQSCEEISRRLEQIQEQDGLDVGVEPYGAFSDSSSRSAMLRRARQQLAQGLPTEALETIEQIPVGADPSSPLADAALADLRRRIERELEVRSESRQGLLLPVAVAVVFVALLGLVLWMSSRVSPLADGGVEPPSPPIGAAGADEPKSGAAPESIVEAGVADDPEGVATSRAAAETPPAGDAPGARPSAPSQTPQQATTESAGSHRGSPTRPGAVSAQAAGATGRASDGPPADDGPALGADSGGGSVPSRPTEPGAEELAAAAPISSDGGETRPLAGAADDVVEVPPEAVPGSPPPSAGAEAEAVPPEREALPEIDLELLQVQGDVRAALGVWEAAWKSLDHRAIGRVEPGAGVGRRELRPYSSAAVSVQGCSIEVDESRTSAVARCTIRRVLQLRSGGAREEVFAAAKLELDAGRWVVRRLE